MALDTMDEEPLFDVEKAFQEFVLYNRRNTQKYRHASDVEAASLIRQIRSRYGHMVSVGIDVLVPLCIACKHSESQWLETALPRFPSVFSDDWRRNYLEMGIPRKKVREASQTLRDGEWRGPQCYQCGSVIELDVPGGEGFYLKSVSLSSFYSLSRGNGRRPPEWMKQIVLDAYEGKCSGCRLTLTPDQVTFDHIVPVSDGGETDMENLQPMCQRCNQEKKNLTVEQVEHPSLLFPLLPASDNLIG
jgi:5-methylcytosine-specific restriction protein A